MLFRQPHFLSPDECQFVRQAMDTGTFEPAGVLSDGVELRPQVRNAALVEPSDAVIRMIEARLESILQPIGGSLRMTLGRREGPGFIRYPDGGYYRIHRDRGADPDWPDAARRAASVVIFLNSSGRASGGDFDGGVLRLFSPDGEVDVVPEAGLLVAFRSDVAHEVTRVHGGTRDSIVDWFYGLA